MTSPWPCTHAWVSAVLLLYVESSGMWYLLRCFHPMRPLCSVPARCLLIPQPAQCARIMNWLAGEWGVGNFLHRITFYKTRFHSSEIFKECLTPCGAKKYLSGEKVTNSDVKIAHIPLESQRGYGINSDIITTPVSLRAGACNRHWWSTGAAHICPLPFCRFRQPFRAGAHLVLLGIVRAEDH